MQNKKILFTVPVLFLLGTILVAQVTTGTILGTVKDSTGAVIPSATVSLRNMATGITRTVVTDPAGRYTAPQLGPGNYEVSAEASGFQTTTQRGIQLTVGQESVINFSLQVGTVSEQVTVTEEAPLIQATTSSISGVVNQAQMRDLPLNARSYEQSPSAVIAKDFDIRVRIMDENGIEKSAMLAGTQYKKTNGIENTKRVNDMVTEYVAKHSDRFPVGVGTVEVTHGDASLKELDRIANELKLRGVVWHHAHSGVQVNHPFMRPILKRMEELKLIPFIHVYRKPYESLWMVEELAEEFPNTTFVALSGLATIEDHDQAIQIAKRQKNILFDTGPVIWVREKGVEGFVKRLGSKRMLFGSDLYAMQPSYRRATTTLDVIKNSLIKPEDKADILRGNVIRLFNVA